MEAMGSAGGIPAASMSYGWKRNKSVEEWLLKEPWQFEFFQALKLLERLHPDRKLPGEATDPEREIAQFESRVTLEYPASEIQRITPPASPSGPFAIAVNLMGLAGQHGPLPLADTERILENVSRRDGAMRDFLDLFNHRLLSIMVRIHKAHHPSMTAQSPERGRTSFYLYSFFGLGVPALRNRLGVPDRSLLYYGGILSQHPRSASGLERLFSDYFRVGTQIRQLVGSWRELEPDQWSRLGLSGQNQTLGSTALLGKRYWDQQGSFEVNLGPLPMKTFSDFLPNGTAFKPLRALTKFYAGADSRFTFRLTLDAQEVPETRLQGNSRLGWTSWLKTKPFPKDDSQVILHAL